MTLRQMRALLFVALLSMLPLPLFGLQQAFVPAARAAMLGGICLLVVLLENAHGVAGVLATIFLLQAGVQAALLWSAAGAVARATTTLSPRTRAALVAGLIVLGLAAGLTQPLYRTPFHARSLQSTLLEVYE